MALEFLYEFNNSRVNVLECGEHDFLTDVLGFPGGSDGKESTCNAGDLDSIPGWGRPPGGGHGKPLQHSCL